MPWISVYDEIKAKRLDLFSHFKQLENWQEKWNNDFQDTGHETIKKIWSLGDRKQVTWALQLLQFTAWRDFLGQYNRERKPRQSPLVFWIWKIELRIREEVLRVERVENYTEGELQRFAEGPPCILICFKGYIWGNRGKNHLKVLLWIISESHIGLGIFSVPIGKRGDFYKSWGID